MACQTEESNKSLDHIYQKYDKFKDEFPLVEDIDINTYLKEQKHYVLVDVRHEREMKVSTLPHALSYKDFLKRQEQYPNQKVITYCTIGYRSGLIADQLRKKKWQVQNLKGGVLAWSYFNRDFVNSENLPTKEVHVYDKTWNLIAPGYKPVW